ncbi:MAG: HupE/UreJ family protein [Burkholderiales bacterium]
MHRIAVALVLAAFSGAVFAHPFHAVTGGASVGFLHPLTGFDHLLAMVAVGLWAARRGGRALWLAPCAFVGAMLAGGVAGFAGASFPATEHLVAGSVLALGLFVALPRTPSLGAGCAMIAAFGAFHGLAHAAELPASASAAYYAAGFVAATALLHAAGVFGGRALRATALRASGIPIALAGVWLVAQVFAA